jgi:hypothetical protein
MATIETRNIIPHLEEELGDFGVDYFNSQLEILRIARSLPKDIDDERLMAPKFYLALKLIEAWISPLQFLIDLELSELENAYRENQNQLSFLLKETNTTSWANALIHENERIPALIKEIIAQKEVIDKKRNWLMEKSTRSKITNLLGLMLYPHSKGTELDKAILEVYEKYYGPNVRYKKSNKYADALIFLKAAIDSFETTKALPKTAEGDEFGKIFRAHRNLREMEEIEDLYRNLKATNSFEKQGLNMRQLNFIFSRVLKKSMTPSERSMFNTDPNFYLEDIDRYRVDKFLEWVMYKLYGREQE